MVSSFIKKARKFTEGVDEVRFKQPKKRRLFTPAFQFFPLLGTEMCNIAVNKNPKDSAMN